MKHPKIIAISALALGLSVSGKSWSVDCNDIFTNGLQTIDGSGVIDLSDNGITLTGGSSVLDAGSVTGSSAGAACSGGACTASGNPGASSTPSFQTGDGSNGDFTVDMNKSATIGDSGDFNYQAIELELGASLTFSSSQNTYYTGGLTADFNTSLTLAPGDYWIDGDFNAGLGTDIITSPSGTVRIFVRGNAYIGMNSDINTDGAGELLFYATGAISIELGTGANGYFYSGSTVTIDKNSTITGGVTGQNISAALNTNINYVQPTASSGDFGVFCDASIPTVDHYAITNSGTALTCEPLTITVEARDASNLPFTPAAATVITLSTDVTVDAWTPSTSYTFTGSESSTTFELSQSTAGIVDIDVSDGLAAAPDDGGAEDQRPTFVDTALRFIEDDGSGGFNTSLSNQIAGTPSPSSGSNTIYVEAVENSQLTNPSAPPQCVGAFPPNTSVDVDLAAECKNPSNCAGVAVSVTNNSISGGIATSTDDTVTSTVAAYTTRALQFDANSRAPLVINYADVGQIQLHGLYEARDGDGNGLGTFISGLSNDFVVSPYSLVITAIETASAASGSNPGTTSAGAGFVAAGDTFYALVEAQDASGNITPNYGNESSPEGISLELDSTLVYPSGGSLGSLANPSVFSVTSTPGEFENSTLSWSEVGTLLLEAHVADGTYLGAGDVSSVNTSGNVGRFYPNDFNLVANITDACVAGNFSYMDQDSITVDVTLEARALGGTVVTNYDNNTLVYNAATAIYYAENDGDGSDLIARFSAPPFSTTPKWTGGQIVVDSGTSAVEFARAASPDGPYNHIQLGVVVSDSLDSRTFDTALDFNPAASANFNASTSADGCLSDGNCSGKKLGDALDLRFGRLLTADSHGPEAAPLPVKLQVEYWNGSLFVINANDSSSTPSSDGCTSILRTRFQLDSADTSADFTVDVGSGDTTGSFAIPADATDLFFSSGTAGLVFSAPTETGSFPLQVFNVEAWLQFDWDQDGNYTDTNLPLATISFGNYRGNDRIIYWREVLNQ